MALSVGCETKQAGDHRVSVALAQPHTTTLLQARTIQVGRGVFRVSELVHDFGDVGPNAELVHTFKFTNAGRSALQFGKPRPSCGCTSTSEIEGVVLSPGETTSLKVSIRPRNERILREFVYVDVGEPATGESRAVTLTVMAIQRFVKLVYPKQLDFGTLAPGKTRARAASVTELTDDRFSITGVDVGHLPLTWNMEESTDSKDLRTYKLRFELKAPSGPAGERTGTIHVATDSKLSPEITVPVQFEVAPWFSAHPGAIAMGEVPVGETRSFVVHIAAADKLPVEVEVLKIPENVTLNVANRSGSVELHVEITLPHAGGWHDKIVARVRSASRAEQIELMCVGVGAEH